MKGYDIDEDIFKTGGKRGIALANAIIERAGGFEAYFSRKSTSKEAPVETKRKSGRRPKPVDYENNPIHLERIAEIALMPFSHLGTGERVWANEYRQRLSRLMHAGYPVEKGFSSKGRSYLVSEHGRIKEEMESLLEQHPEIKERIYDKKRKLQAPFRY